jgi:hypothetical protein
MELVRQLLEYKAFKDAARSLGAAAQVQALKHPRHPAVQTPDADQLDIEEAQIWDLLEAFNRLLEQTGRRAGFHEVVYDDTPIALHAADMVDLLQRAGGSQQFEYVFEGRTRSELIGLFLALLELIRQKRVRAEQERNFGTIFIHLLDPTPIEADSTTYGQPVMDAPTEAGQPGSPAEEPAPAADQLPTPDQAAPPDQSARPGQSSSLDEPPDTPRRASPVSRPDDPAQTESRNDPQ